MARFATVILWVVALFYAYGAIVHVMNMLGLSGFSWLDAPLKWQALDVLYLALDVGVALGFITRWRPAFAAFYTAAITQIILYTLLRDWILDVPPAFAVSAEQVAYLDALVVFHVITIVAVTFARKNLSREWT